MAATASFVVGNRQFAECRKCHSRLLTHLIPRTDECGFESYHLHCSKCGARLAGIIDPLDGALLFSEVESRKGRLVRLSRRRTANALKQTKEGGAKA